MYFASKILINYLYTLRLHVQLIKNDTHNYKLVMQNYLYTIETSINKRLAWNGWKSMNNKIQTQCTNCGNEKTTYCIQIVVCCPQPNVIIYDWCITRCNHLRVNIKLVYLDIYTNMYIYIIRIKHTVFAKYK